MTVFNFRIYIVLLLILLSTPTFSSAKFLSGTYVGVINIHQSNDVSLYKTSANAGTYFLHTSIDNKPFKLVFKQGQPHKPIMTGDKVLVIGLIAANTLYVDKIRSLPVSVSPF